jgi:hypothetical protein
MPMSTTSPSEAETLTSIFGYLLKGKVRICLADEYDNVLDSRIVLGHLQMYQQTLQCMS